MNSRSVREKQGSKSLPAGAGGVMPIRRDRSEVLFDLQKKRREMDELDAEKEERKQVLENFHQRKEELVKKVEEVEKLFSSYDILLKNEETVRVAEKAKKEKKEGLQREAEIRRLKEELSELVERRQKPQRRVQRDRVYQDFMEQVVKMTKFGDVQRLAGHLESLLDCGNELHQKDSELQEQVYQQRKALRTLEEERHLLRLHKNNQLSQLYRELEKTRSDALTWEKKWNHIQETAAKKTLLLGKIKIATLNLYELIDDGVRGEEGVNVNDTETQLDKVTMFIHDLEAIERQHQTPSNRRNEGRTRKEPKRDKTKKLTAAKKD